MSRFILPRGQDGQSAARPTATARWASKDEIVSHRFNGEGLWLGVHYEIPPAGQNIHDRLSKLADELEQSSHLNADWRDTHVELARRHMAALHTEPQAVGTADDMHVGVFSSTRAGKGTTAVVPNLCLYKGSVLGMDPKGENASLTAARRGDGDGFCEGMGQIVQVLDPVRVADIDDKYRAAWNCLDLVDINSPHRTTRPAL